jgi:WD40 repeat protein
VNNTPFTPRNIMVHDEGNKILALTPKKTVLCRMDTETGKNIGQLNVKLFHSSIDGCLDTVVPLKKFSQLKTNNQLSLAAICGNSVTKVNWDVRTPVVKDYVIDKHESFTKAQRGFRFSAITTTKEGNIAVGSKDGSIRLFASGDVIKRAKTELSQLADPIIGLDVSADGEWILGTTEKYIIVFKTTWSDHKGTHSAFNSSMPPDQKRLLVLRIPEKQKIKYSIDDEDISFTTARFDNSPYETDISEQDIVTSTGYFVVRFKFCQVKKDYKLEPRRQKRALPIIYRQDDEIVDKTFSYQSDSIVVALGHDLKQIALDENSENKENE